MFDAIGRRVRRRGVRCAVALFAVLVPHGALAQAPDASRERAPCKPNAFRTAAQIVAGYAGAAGLGLAAWAAIDDPYAPDRRVQGDAGYQPNANTAYAIGSFVGGTLAAYGAGKLAYPGCGSLLRTSIATASISVFMLLGRDEPYLPLIGISVVAPLQAIAGALAFLR